MRDILRDQEPWKSLTGSAVGAISGDHADKLDLARIIPKKYWAPADSVDCDSIN